MLVEELPGGDLRIMATEKVRERMQEIGARVVAGHGEALQILADHDPESAQLKLSIQSASSRSDAWSARRDTRGHRATHTRSVGAHRIAEPDNRISIPEITNAASTPVAPALYLHTAPPAVCRAGVWK